MSTHRIFFLRPIPLAALLIAIAVQAEAADRPSEERNLLIVTGRGEVSIPATHADIDVAVEMRDRTPGNAQQAAAQRTARVLEFLRESPHVERLQTSALALRPIFEEARPVRPGGERPIVGYVAVIGMSFRVPAEQAGTVVDGTVERGATRVGGFVLTATEEAVEAARREAFQEASRQALERGDAVLSALGLERREIVRIQVEPEHFMPFRGRQEAMAMSADAATPVEAGQQRIGGTISLHVRY